MYKRQRAELSALKAEAGVLTRTVEILRARDEGVLRGLVCFLIKILFYLRISYILIQVFQSMFKKKWNVCFALRLTLTN